VVPIDCDANATYAPSQALRSRLPNLLESLGNPSSLHQGGQAARALVEDARASVRKLVSARSRDVVVFTSGATEANTTIINSFATEGRSIVSSTIEHPSILAPLARAALSVQVRSVAPSAEGVVDPAKVAEAVDETTALVSIMAANNETGVVNPIRDIARAVRARAPRVVVHTDAAQLAGKGVVSLDELEVDILTLSAHKIGGVSGAGAVVCREGIELRPLILGGPQEAKLRGGTENVLGAGMFGLACDLVREELEQRVASMREARDAFEEALLDAVPGIEINSRTVARLPNTTSVYIPGVRADDLVVALDLEGVFVSSGAACSSGKPEPSHVLLAMGQSPERVRSTIRVSMRSDYAPGTVDRLVSIVERTVRRMRGSSK
jgi:cysteine desulfurase